jgi:hypothetical protein
MTYNEIYKILSFEKIKIDDKKIIMFTQFLKKNYCHYSVKQCGAQMQFEMT